MTALVSLACETNGLAGFAFAAAATLTTPEGVEVDRWQARCPIPSPVEPWVARNVLPAITDMPETRDDYFGLLDGWRGWYDSARRRFPEPLVVTHIPVPVEARFLSDAHADNPAAAPYPLIDVAPLLHAAGHDPASVDAYLAGMGLPKPEGSPHHPLYDARAAVVAFRHLTAEPPAARKLRAAAAGRRELAKALEGDPRFTDQVKALHLQADTLDDAALVAAGDHGPMYGWLPSHRWTQPMLAALYGNDKPALGLNNPERIHAAGEAAGAQD